MKTKIGISSVVIAAFCATLPAPAQQTPVSRDSMRHDRDHLGKMEKASKIIGMEIKDPQNQKLGKVKDLAVDLQNGRIVEVIVARGGVLGVDERLVAVPPGQFTCDAAANTIQLNTDKARFNAAPTFKLADWESNGRQNDVGGVYQYYGVQPYFTADGQPAATANVRLGDVQRAEKIIGSAVHNLQNEKVGKVENLMVDLPSGRVVEVIVASGGFLGLGDELSAVPPQSFHRATAENALSLDTTKEALTRAPHFKSSEWSEFNDPEHVGTVYHAYNVDPYFTTTNSADNTAQNMRDRGNNTLTPLNQGTSEADMETTRQIRKQVIAAEGLSVDARNVKIITIDGKVTLRGPVKSEEEKRRIADIAAGVATAANVDNQLQVAGTSTSSVK